MKIRFALTSLAAVIAFGNSLQATEHIFFIYQEVEGERSLVERHDDVFGGGIGSQQGGWGDNAAGGIGSGSGSGTSGGGGGGVGGNTDTSNSAKYEVRYQRSFYSYPFRQIAKIESPGGAKISFQYADSVKKMWTYEISALFTKFGITLGSSYEQSRTLTIGWEMQLPQEKATYSAVANEGIITDIYDIYSTALIGGGKVAADQAAQKHDKIAVELYKDGTKVN